MKNLNVDYTMDLRFSEAVTDHSFLLRCVPTERGCQTVLSHSLAVLPDVPLLTYRDVFGNTVWRGQCYSPHRSFSFHANATVQVYAMEGTRGGCHPFYKYPTPLTACSERMADYLRSIFKQSGLRENAFKGNAGLEPPPVQETLAFAQALAASVHGHIEYKSGSTNVKTTAAEAFESGQGVCQDYAHLFISLCRQAGIAARYVCGMSTGEGATHAWAEFFVPDGGSGQGKGNGSAGKWFGIDPTRNKKVDDTYVVLAVGRDFSDCQVDRGVFCGSVEQSQTVHVRTYELPPPGPTGTFSGHAVSGGSDMAGQQ